LIPDPGFFGFFAFRVLGYDRNFLHPSVLGVLSLVRAAFGPGSDSCFLVKRMVCIRSFPCFVSAGGFFSPDSFFRDFIVWFSPSPLFPQGKSLRDLPSPNWPADVKWLNGFSASHHPSFVVSFSFFPFFSLTCHVWTRRPVPVFRSLPGCPAPSGRSD